jgi:3-oxoacyl-[acyl-carrier-protein] synthase-3
MPDYGAIIAGTGSFVPEKRLTNEELSKLVDTNDEWIVSGRDPRAADRRQGRVDRHARHRRRPPRDRGGGLEPKDIDLVLCGTITPEMIFPSTACFVAAALG